jgi:hypothetical protein
VVDGEPWRPTRVHAGALVAVVAVQLVFSLRFFAKYAPVAPGLLYALFVVGGVGLTVLAVSRPCLTALLASRTVVGLASAGLVVALLYAYPRAIALAAVGRGSDQDDCVALLVDNVLALREPYSLSYGGNPCSTGPAELLLYLPVAVSRAWFAVVPVLTVALGYWVLSRLVDRRLARLLTLTQFVSLLFLELSAVGSDFVLIGWLFAAAVVLARDGLRDRDRLLVVLGGPAYLVFAGSRVPLAASAAGSVWVLVVLFGGRGARLAVSVAVGTAATYLAAYLAGPSSFGPAHLFGKAGRLLGELGFAATVLVVAVAGALAVGTLLPAFRRIAERHYLALNLALVLLPMAVAAAGELAARGYDVARWEGLNYLLLAVPALLVAVAGRLAAGNGVPVAAPAFVPPRPRAVPPEETPASAPSVSAPRL